MARRVLLLTGLGTLVLPFFHAAVFGLNAMFFWVDPPSFDRMGSIAYYVLNSVRLLSGFAIPMFLFAAGYFSVFMMRGREIKDAIRGKSFLTQFTRLLPPFLIWTTIHLAINFQMPDSIHAVLRPYYFLPLLVQLYFLGPWLTKFASNGNGWKWLLVLTGLLHIFLEGLHYLPLLGFASAPWMQFVNWATPIWFFPEHIFWFALGIVLSLKIDLFRTRLERLGRLWPVLVVVFAALCLLEYEYFDRLDPETWLGTRFNGLAREFYSLAVVLYVILAEKVLLPGQNIVSYLGARSFAVYLANSPAIYLASTLMFQAAPWLLDFQPVYQAVLIIVGFGAPLMLINLFAKTRLRGLYRYVFG